LYVQNPKEDVLPPVQPFPAGRIQRRLRFYTALLIWLVLVAGSGGSARAQGAAAPSINSPLPGQVLRGRVQIIGTSDVPGFVSSEVAFAYAGDLTGTWFPIQASASPLTDDLLADWDTESISDGDYILRLRVTLQDGSPVEVQVAGLQVRNYTAGPAPTAEPSATPTATPKIEVPTAVLVAPTAMVLAPASKASVPTPTPFPPNPAALTSAAIYASLRRGALMIGLLFVAFGVLLRLRRP
jgi:hypothetical protein